MSVCACVEAASRCTELASDDEDEDEDIGAGEYFGPCGPCGSTATCGDSKPLVDPRFSSGEFSSSSWLSLSPETVVAIVLVIVLPLPST